MDLSGVIAISGLDCKKLTAMTKMPIGKRDGDDSLFEIACDGTLIQHEISDMHSDENVNGNERDVVTGIVQIDGFIDQNHEAVDRVACDKHKTSEYCLLSNLPLHLRKGSAVYSKNESKTLVVGGLSNTYIILLKKVYSLDRLRINSNDNDYNNCNNNSHWNSNGDLNGRSMEMRDSLINADETCKIINRYLVLSQWMVKKIYIIACSGYTHSQNWISRYLWSNYSNETDNENTDNHMKYTGESAITKDTNDNYCEHQQRTITKITTTATTSTNTLAAFLHSLAQIADKFAVLFAFYGLSDKDRKKFSLFVWKNWIILIEYVVFQKNVYKYMFIVEIIQWDENWHCLKMTIQIIKGIYH